MTSVSKNQMILTTFMLPAGYHKDSWRRPCSRVEELGFLDFVSDITQMAEAAKLHSIFFGDINHADTILRGDIKMTGLYEPVSVLSALAARTLHIGLMGTMSTSFSEPYNVARQILGIDLLSGGRCGWNVVTSSTGFQNYGIDDVPDHDERYRRATEFLEVVEELWDSWADDAVIANRESGWWADPAKIHAINHVGEYFKVAGPINMRRSPQGRPVIVQAGSSGPGMQLGARFAEVIYTAQPLKQPSIDFYTKFKTMVKDFGRAPDQTKIIPGILPILGETEKEAAELANELGSYVNMDNGRTQVGADLKLDLSSLDLDETIPPAWFSDDPDRGSRYQIYKMKSVDQAMTLRELIVDLARSTGHQWMAGTPSQVADRMIEWFDDKACDGFNLNAPYYPDGFKTICDTLIPELQNRGYFHEDYEGTTLRENLGIDRPTA